MVKVKKSSLKKGSELRAAVPSPKPSVEAAASANPSKKLKKKGAKVAEVKGKVGKVEKPSAGLALGGDSEAAGKVDKAQLAAQATEEILRGIAKPDSQKISAFVLADWHLKYKDVLGSYKKFVKASDKLQVVEREDGNYIIQKAGDTSVPPPPEAKEPKTKDWKQLLLNAWNIYHQATPKQAGLTNHCDHFLFKRGHSKIITDIYYYLLIFLQYPSIVNSVVQDVASGVCFRPNH